MKRVLLVDDNEELSHSMARIFSKHDFHWRPNGESALPLLDVREHWDLILVDIRMYPMTGLGFVKVLGRRRPELLLATRFITGWAMPYRSTYESVAPMHDKKDLTPALLLSWLEPPESP